MADTSGGTESNAASKSEELIPLSAAAKAAPGRPSANAIWRWCRRGVRARGGVCVRLRHVRLGGRVFTSLAWLTEFGEQLAAADAEHFDSRSRDHTRPVASRVGAVRAGETRSRVSPEEHKLAIELELKAEGL